MIGNSKDNTIHEFNVFIILIEIYCETESIPTICLEPRNGEDIERKLLLIESKVISHEPERCMSRMLE